MTAPADSRIVSKPGNAFVVRMAVNNFRVNGFVPDAVKWNVAWEVVVYLSSGKSHTFQLKRHDFAVDHKCMENKDYTIVIPKD